MPMEPFLVNPPRRLLAYGLNPRRRRRSKRNPLTRVKFPEHVSTLFRVSKSGRWGRKRRRKNPAKGRVPEHLRPFLFKKGRKPLSRRAPPAQKEHHMARRRRKSRRVKARRRNPVILGANPRRRKARRRNPVILGANPRRRRRSFRRSNPFIPSVSKLGLPPMSEMLWLGFGAVAARTLVPRALLMLPVLSKNPIVRGLSRIGLSAAAGFIAKKTLGANAKAFTYGVLANQVPEALNDFLSLAGIKLSDGNADLELYTLSDGPEAIEHRPDPGMGLYTLSEGESEEVPGAVSLG